MLSWKPGTEICLDTFEVVRSVSAVAVFAGFVVTHGFGFFHNESEDDVIQLLIHFLLPSLDGFQSSFQVLEYSDVLR